MRYLNKIIMINSADVKYAPINLNGNVHLIGDQGAGKSTILRAILFFYNADSQNLGIPKGPTNDKFADFYFPYLNSRIIYEVKTETGAFCVMAFKTRNRVSFRFLDTEYKKDIFIDEQGKAYSNWDQIRKILDKDEISYTPMINNYKKYRHIIYGSNYPDQRYSRYYLLKSQNYKNIPRTIQNVFLNSKLEAEFIKQTIIKSMHEEKVAINLNNYIHHLQNFEEHLNDIEILEKEYTQKLINQIEEDYSTIKYLEKELIKLSQKLSYALSKAQELKPEILDKLDETRQKYNQKKQELQKKQEKYDNKLQDISGQISICKDKISTARQKKKKYAQMNIEEIIKRVNKKSELEQEKENLQDEKSLLEAKYQEITQKYKALQKELKNQKNEFINSKNEDKNQLKDEYLQKVQKVKKQYEDIYQEIKEQQQEKLENKQAELKLKTDRIHKLENQLTEAKHKNFYGSEIEDLKNKIGELKNEQQENSNQLSRLKDKKSTYRQRAKLEKKSARESYTNEIEKIEEIVQSKQKDIQSIETKISKSENSFYGWLNRNKDSWDANIGKVCDEEILFQDNLNPRLLEEGTANFYNVEINLEKIQSQVKTIQDYKSEKRGLEQDIEKLQEQINTKKDELQDEIERIKNRYNRKIKKLNKKINETEVEIDQGKKKLDSTRVKLNKYQSKAEEKREQLINEKQNQIEKVVEQKEKLKQEYEELEQKKKNKIKYRKRCEREDLKELKENLKEELNSIDETIDNKVEKIDKQIQDIESQKKSALKEKGANTKRIEEIEARLLEIDNELDYIDEKQRIVIEYQKDKKELFDQLPDLRNKKNLLTNKLEEVKENFAAQKKALKNEISEIKQEINELENKVNRIENYFQKYENFQKCKVYEYVENYLNADNQEKELSKNIAELIGEVKDSYYRKEDKTKNLERAISRFSGEFSDDNIFKFPTIFSTDEDYLEFADELIDFKEEDKLEVYKKRVNERFADIIKTIGQEITNIISHKSEIRKVITKINKDFIKKNFVGAVKKIELKMDDSNNEVFSILHAIKEFNDQNMYSFGKPTIFSDQDRDEQNQKAIQLLKRLVDKIRNNKYEQISLSDSFDLMFRIEENQNDTGWVEKLSNVGSHGTDVLVKAMVNIMLLNVFKESATNKNSDFKLHCVMDEIGQLHPENVRGILRFANERNISLINGSPTENNPLDYRHIYKIQKDEDNISQAVRIISNV